MPKHDFYADPTVFDHLQANAGGWMCSRLERFCPYAWVTGFCLFAALFLFAGVTVLGLVVHGALAAESGLAGNQALAGGIVVIVSLIAAQTLLQQGVGAWPDGRDLPRRFYVAARFIGLQQPLQARTSGQVAAPAPQASRAAAAETRAVQEFFAGVRAAGVNVAIARALFDAGVRSADQLRGAPDAQLLAIRGVGAATVHKLRVQFGSQADAASAPAGQHSPTR